MIDTIVVVDTETTGVSPEEGAHLLELAYVPLQRCTDETSDDVPSAWSLGDPQSDLIAYDVAAHGPIPPEARAVHHLSEDDVRPGAPGVMERDVVLHGMLCAEVAYEMAYAAHNAAFDSKFLPELGAGGTIPWICTYRCAMHIWPEAPRHSNQVLRYWLGEEPPAELLEVVLLPAGGGVGLREKLAPHRAQYDAVVTAMLLRRMLAEHSVADLVRLTAAPILLDSVRFGKHRGQKWSELPRDYLNWLLRSSDVVRDDADVRHTVRHYLGLPPT